MKMVRTKVYTKEKILNVAEKILVDKGFSNLTARNIADTWYLYAANLFRIYQHGRFKTNLN